MMSAMAMFLLTILSVCFFVGCVGWKEVSGTSRGVRGSSDEKVRLESSVYKNALDMN